MAIVDEERVRIDEDEIRNQQSKRFWKGVLRTYGAMLFYGGITTVIFHVVRFIVSVILDYSFYKEEIAEIISLAICVIAYPLLVGLRHVENCGYIDEHDGCFKLTTCIGRLAATMGLMLIIPIMVFFRINFLIMYVYSFCYGFPDKIAEIISEEHFHTIDATTPEGVMIAAFIVFGYMLVTLLPFFYLGRRNCRVDRSMGLKVKVQ